MGSSSAVFDGHFVCVADFEREARAILPRNALDYYKSGADDEFTLSLNKESMKKWRIRPRVLRDVSERSLQASVLGSTVSVPIGVSPTAMQRMAHPEGELANCKAVEAIGGVYILSTLSTSSIEEVAQAAPRAVKWFQLYIYKDRTVTTNLVRRAEAAGFKALVLTVDAPIFGNRRADVRNKFKLPSHLRLANFTDLQKSKGITSSTAGSGLDEYVRDLFDTTVSWEDVKWLKQLTRLPLVLKGVLTKEDSVMGVEAGVDAIFVSNHGARQVDGVPSSMEALPEIVQAIHGRCEIFVDGGFQKGDDIFKALALGANMVFIGRPALWGLAHSGQAGVQKVLEILRAELDRTMALSGCTSIKEIVRNMIVHESYYSRL